MPSEIWHYTDANGLLGMVRDRGLWAGCTDFMNDEKEAIRGIEMLRSRWGNEGSETLNPEDGEEIELAIANMESSKERQYIVSSSEQSDSLTMWRNYGREAVSYAVQLDPSVNLALVPIPKYSETEEWPDAPDDYLQPYFEVVQEEDGSTHSVLTGHPDSVHSRQRGGWKRVEYTEAKQIEIVDGVAEAIIKYRSGLKGKPGNHLWEFLHQMRWEEQLTLIKDRGFHHEEEARLHFFGVTPEWRFVHYRSTSLGVTPYIVLTEASDQTQETDGWGSGTFESVPRRLPIVAVRIGPTRYPDLAERGLRSLLNENGYTNVEILKSEVPFR